MNIVLVSAYSSAHAGEHKRNKSRVSKVDFVKSFMLDLLNDCIFRHIHIILSWIKIPTNYVARLAEI